MAGLCATTANEELSALSSSENVTFEAPHEAATVVATWTTSSIGSPPPTLRSAVVMSRLLVEDAVAVAKALKAEGVAYICASSGGNSPHQKLPSGPGYQVHLAEAVRKGADIPTRAVGLITEPRLAEAIVSEGRADMVALGRGFLADPRWGWRAAAAFGETIHAAPQLLRAVTTLEHWVKAPG